MSAPNTPSERLSAESVAPMRVLSLGAGVQSTTVALMSAYGELSLFDAAIFADTGWEPQAVYDHLDKLEEALAEAGIPVYRVGVGNIRDDHIAPTGDHLFIRNPVRHPEWLGRQRSFIPFYVVGKDGAHGITYRTCTKTYKIEPVEKKIRDLLGLKPRQRWPEFLAVEQYLGISWDESQRMKDSLRPAIRNIYPLVDLRMTRDDCHQWMANHGWTAPRSACIGCPYHRNDEWRRLRDEDPEAFKEAVLFDHRIRERQAAGLMALNGVPFIHDSRVPLADANIDEPDVDQLSLFGNECEGMCGV